jgi:glycosyltransferase involved in cell wall biosynthesis
MQAGSFSFVAETIRSFVEDQRSWRVHVTTDALGRDVLRARLGAAAARIRFHWPGRRSRSRRRVLRHDASTVEIVVWRGHYRFARSRKIAVIQDLTTRIVPELHTAGNVAEFESYLAYVRKHAHIIATVSHHSRRDIVERLDVRPGSVHVVAQLVHPSYMQRAVDPTVPARHGLAAPYVLTVGTIEPRKNLRRLVKAFELLGHEELMRDVVLALAGPPGWDDSFDRDLIASDAYPRVRRLGFVPLDDMPSLYRFASAVVYPSVYEGFGLPVLEALCSSSIVLTSSTTSLGEIAGGTVSTFDPFDVSSMAGALLHALAMTPAEAAAYRVRCRTRGEMLLGESSERPSFPTLVSHGFGEHRCASPSYSHSFI